MTPPLITHEPTTTAPIDDSIATAAMHAALQTKGLLPRCHIVNAGYVDAERLAVSQRDDALDLWGALQGRVRWQAHGEGAFDLSRLVIDWERQQVTCPAGHTSLSWTPAIDNRDHDVINIKFARSHCCDCRYRAQCSRNVRRTLTVQPQEPHEALMANRKRQSMPALKAEQARRCGIEGTRSYGVRTWDMRRARYSEDFTRVLARRLTTILPAMTLADALETTRLHRVAGRTGERTAVVTTRPFRAPHHTISEVGLIGGGQVPRPVEVSLAHHGVRFLDKLPECRRHVLEGLRQPLEESVT